MVLLIVYEGNLKIVVEYFNIAQRSIAKYILSFGCCKNKARYLAYMTKTARSAMKYCRVVYFLKCIDASKTRRASTVEGSVLGVHDLDGTERNEVLRSIYAF